MPKNQSVSSSGDQLTRKWLDSWPRRVRLRNNRGDRQSRGEVPREWLLVETRLATGRAAVREIERRWEQGGIPVRDTVKIHARPRPFVHVVACPSQRYGDNMICVVLHRGAVHVDEDVGKKGWRRERRATG